MSLPLLSDCSSAPNLDPAAASAPPQVDPLMQRLRPSVLPVATAVSGGPSGEPSLALLSLHIPFARLRALFPSSLAWQRNLEGGVPFVAPRRCAGRPTERAADYFPRLARKECAAISLLLRHAWTRFLANGVRELLSRRQLPAAGFAIAFPEERSFEDLLRSMTLCFQLFAPNCVPFAAVSAVGTFFQYKVWKFLYLFPIQQIRCQKYSCETLLLLRLRRILAKFCSDPCESCQGIEGTSRESAVEQRPTRYPRPAVVHANLSSPLYLTSSSYYYGSAYH